MNDRMHDISPGMHQGLELEYTQDQTLLVEQKPLRTEFLDHLQGAQDFFSRTRDSFIDGYPFIGHTRFFVVVGRTGVGKRTAISQWIHQAKNDQKLKDWQESEGVELDFRYIAFAESANLAKLEGSIPADKKHGTYTLEEYREASKVNSRFVLAESNNFERPTWVFVEASGLGASVNPNTGAFEGPDRATSTIHLLGRHFSNETRLMVIDPGPGVVDKTVQTRANIEQAQQGELPDVLEASKLQIAKKGEIIDLRKLSLSELTKLQQEFFETMSSSQGVLRSNQETDDLKAALGTEDETEFWAVQLYNLGINRSQIEFVRNELTDTILTIHPDELYGYDPIYRQAEAIRKLQQPRVSPDTEITFSDVIKTAGRWFKKDFRQLQEVYRNINP